MHVNDIHEQKQLTYTRSCSHALVHPSTWVAIPVWKHANYMATNTSSCNATIGIPFNDVSMNKVTSLTSTFQKFMSHTFLNQYHYLIYALFHAENYHYILLRSCDKRLCKHNLFSKLQSSIIFRNNLDLNCECFHSSRCVQC